MPNVTEIVIEYLKAGKFDGLANGAIECGCFVDDIAPCGEIGGKCRPGHKAIIDEELVCVEARDA